MPIDFSRVEGYEEEFIKFNEYFNQITENVSNGYIPYFESGLAFNSSLFQDSKGNIGFLTENPESELDVRSRLIIETDKLLVNTITPLSTIDLSLLGISPVGNLISTDFTARDIIPPDDVEFITINRTFIPLKGAFSVNEVKLKRLGIGSYPINEFEINTSENIFLNNNNIFNVPENTSINTFIAVDNRDGIFKKVSTQKVKEKIKESFLTTDKSTFFNKGTQLEFEIKPDVENKGLEFLEEDITRSNSQGVPTNTKHLINNYFNSSTKLLTSKIVLSQNANSKFLVRHLKNTEINDNLVINERGLILSNPVVLNGNNANRIENSINLVDTDILVNEQKSIKFTAIKVKIQTNSDIIKGNSVDTKINFNEWTPVITGVSVYTDKDTIPDSSNILNMLSFYFNEKPLSSGNWELYIHNLHGSGTNRPTEKRFFVNLMLIRKDVIKEIKSK